VPFPGETNVFDDCTRANGAAEAGAGATIWQNMDLGGAASSLNITGNELAWDGTGDGNGTLTVNDDADFIRIFDVTALGSYFAYFFRLSDADGADWEGYWLIVSGNSWKLRKRVGGSSTDVASVTESSIAGDGDLVGLRAYGDLLEVYHLTGGDWTSVISVEDSSFSADGVQALALGGTNMRVGQILSADPSLAAPEGPFTIYVDPDHASSSDSYNRTQASDPATPVKTMQKAAQLAYATPEWGDTISVAYATVADATNADPRMYYGIDNDVFTTIPLPFGDNTGNEPITVSGEPDGDDRPLVNYINGHELKNWVFEDFQQGYDQEDVSVNNLGSLSRCEDLTFRRIHYTSGGYNVDCWSGELLWDDCEINAPLTTFGQLDGRGFGFGYLPIDGQAGEGSGLAHFDGCRFIGIRGNDAIQAGLGGVTEEWSESKLLVENCLFHDVAEGIELYHTDSIQCLGGYEFEVRNSAFIGCSNALVATDFHNRKIIFENNLCVGSGGIVQLQGTDDFVMQHNTLISYGFEDSAVIFFTRFIGATNKVTIQNNILGGIFYRDSTAEAHDDASVIDHNIVMTDPGWDSGFGTNLVGLPEFGYSARLADIPTERLVNPPPDWASTPFTMPPNYELANDPFDSPGIGQGVAVSGLTHDRLGRAYSNPPDVGCHQSDPGTVVTAVARAPYVLDRVPAPNSTSVSKASDVSLILFPKPGNAIDEDTIIEANARLTDPGGESIPLSELALDDMGGGVYRIRMDPDGNLFPYVVYTARFESEIADEEGAELAEDVSWSFRVIGTEGPAVGTGGHETRFWHSTYRVEEGYTAVEPTPEDDPNVIDFADLTPTIDQVALLLRTRTVGPSSGGLGGDTGPGDTTTFTASTRPTATEVGAVIQTAYGAVEAMLRKPIPESEVASVQHAVALYAAILIETSFFRENSNAEALGAMRGMLRDTVAGINEMTVLNEGRGFGTLRIGTTFTSNGQQQTEDVIPGLDT
jgi:hypothetical protein